MKRSAAKSTKRIIKLGSLSCLAIFMLQLMPTNEERKNDSPIAGTKLRRRVQHRAFIPSMRSDGEGNSVTGKFLITEEFRNPAVLQQHQLAGLPSSVKANTRDGDVEEDKDSIENLEQSVLTAQKIGEALDAVEALTQTNDVDRARQVLSGVLRNNQHAEVRLAALDALDEIDEVPIEALAQAASNDSDSEIRLRALDLIGERKDKDGWVFQLLNRVARTDSNRDVRRSAASLLEAMIRVN